jgi:hypothetical protein
MRSALIVAIALLLPAYPRPNHKLTPGDVLTRDAQKVCTAGYSRSVRSVSAATKRAVYASYGISSWKPGQYEVDHLISLELGGSNSQKNLWPEPTPGSYSKDSLENALHRAICAKRISIDSAQRWIARDWVSAYRAMKKGKL